MKRFVYLLAVLVAAAFVAGSTMAQTNPFVGTWKLNVAKSKFNPGPPFKSFTLTFTPDGTRKLDLMIADDQPLKAELPWSDGKEVSVTVIQGMESATSISTIQGKTFHDTWKQNGKIIEKVHGVLSPDGRTLTITVDGTPRQGGAYQNRLTFEKQ